MRVRRTRMWRVLALWGGLFLLTMFLIARPTGFSWPFWIYGLIWGCLTSAIHYAFRRYFEEEIDVRQDQFSKD